MWEGRQLQAEGTARLKILNGHSAWYPPLGGGAKPRYVGRGHMECPCRWALLRLSSRETRATGRRWAGRWHGQPSLLKPFLWQQKKNEPEEAKPEGQEKSFVTSRTSAGRTRSNGRVIGERAMFLLRVP